MAQPPKQLLERCAFIYVCIRRCDMYTFRNFSFAMTIDKTQMIRFKALSFLNLGTHHQIHDDRSHFKTSL